MPRVPKSRFVNRVALRKAIRGYSAKDLRKAITPAFNRGANKMKRIAKRNAPVKSGSLRGSIGIEKVVKSGTRSGKIATWYVRSRSIQDAVITYGIPNQKLTAQMATKRSRTINGIKHRMSASFNYAGKQRTKTGKIAKRQPLDKNGKPWAFGKRRTNRFLTDNQTFRPDLEKMAEDIGNRIRLQIATAFAKNIKVSR